MFHSHSVFVCWQQRGPTVPPPAEMEAARAAALARLPQPAFLPRLDDTRPKTRLSTQGVSGFGLGFFPSTA